MADDRFCTVTPLRCTSCGKRLSAACTRLLTLTVLMSGLLPSANDTVRP